MQILRMSRTLHFYNSVFEDHHPSSILWIPWAFLIKRVEHVTWLRVCIMYYFKWCLIKKFTFNVPKITPWYLYHNSLLETYRINRKVYYVHKLVSKRQQPLLKLLYFSNCNWSDKIKACHQCHCSHSHYPTLQLKVCQIRSSKDENSTNDQLTMKITFLKDFYARKIGIEWCPYIMRWWVIKFIL